MTQATQESTSTLHQQASNDEDGMDLTGPGASTGWQTDQPQVSGSNLPSTNPPDNDADWQTVLLLRQRKQQALERRRNNAVITG
ncbi:hypothetical protein HPB50_007095 [Hyalomma asiaticum]|uniref:Uncharacterized protein n=1 Tax=Hyalomma asiaticum TaxID=266040 RepID=A0ACB7SR79_HYAAI|nr:hypothetical protein HPB50_007095 [Hyalomma asiaticum]